MLMKRLFYNNIIAIQCFCIFHSLGKASGINFDDDTIVILQTGIRGSLLCEVKVRTDTILWLKGSMVILRYRLENGDWQKYLAGNAEGSYDIDAKYSLIIQNVTIDSEDVYYCDVFDSDTGEIGSEEVNVVVFGKSSSYNIYDTCAN